MPTQNVLLIHGILMRPLVMHYLGGKLKRAGFNVHYVKYPSFTRTPAQNAARIHERVRQSGFDNLHIVAHSLGGIVALHLLQYDDVPHGHVVMLGAPVRGSYLAQRLRQWPLVGKLLEKSLQEGLSGVAVPGWRFPERAWGMIIGTRNLGLGWLIGGLPEPGDGTVMKRETLHQAQKESIEVSASHTGMLFSSEVADKIIKFLRTASFA